jgi:hypothetical protein
MTEAELSGLRARNVGNGIAMPLVPVRLFSFPHLAAWPSDQFHREATRVVDPFAKSQSPPSGVTRLG